jgi:hypothetical protein
MIQGKKKVVLTMESVLNKISEYDIFRMYMPDKSWKLNKVTNSPFRRDDNPSFVIGNKKGYLSYIDFGDVNFRGDCFTFVKQMFNLPTMDDVLKTIDRDFGLGINGEYTGKYKQIKAEYKQPEESKRTSLIQVVSRKFTKEELEYWAQYHQSIEDLRSNNIYSISKLYHNRQLFSLKDTELRFGYLYDGHWKIYRPFADKKFKWVPNNVPITMMDGKENIVNCDVAFITKSKKDYMVVKKVFPCACGVQNESTGCFSHENVEYLKANSDRQILGFDSDVPGVKNSQQITKLFDFDYCNVPKKYLSEGIKDFADLGRIHGLETVKQIIINKINKQ